MPGITPSDKPKGNEKEVRAWKHERQKWKDITCSCGYGYFDDNGVWISGAAVRARRQPGNPRWAHNDFRNPDTTNSSASRHSFGVFERGSSAPLRRAQNYVDDDEEEDEEEDEDENFHYNNDEDDDDDEKDTIYEDYYDDKD